MLRLESSSAAPRSLSETRVWASRISVPNGIWSEPTLTRSSHQRCSAVSTTLVSEYGKYTQADPLGLGPDINVYRYATSNPVGIDDPLGLDTAGCDEIGKYQINETPCRLECCAQHDQCYDLNHCSSGSWPDRKPKTACDTTAGCRKCNEDVKDCFKKCLRKEVFGTKDDPKRPNYYCGAQHRFIRIPGDFANISDARKACECDYSKSCGLPSKPLTPTLPNSRP